MLRLRSPTRRAHPTAIALAAALTLVTAASAQRRPLPPPGAIAPPAAEAESGPDEAFDRLLTLPGRLVDVLYSGDALDRAARLQSRLEALHGLWQPLTRELLLWQGLAVQRETWERIAGGAPWGVPKEIETNRFAVAAQGDPATVEAMVALFGRPLPDPGGDPLIGTREEAGSLVAGDVLLQLRVARRFAATARLRGEAPWIEGVAAHLAARYAWESVEPDRVLEVVALLDRASLALGGPRRHRLEAYRDGLPLELDLWYQAQFVRGADAIWVEEGRRGVARLLTKWSRRGRVPAHTELEKKYPELAAWATAAFAP